MSLLFPSLLPLANVSASAQLLLFQRGDLLLNEHLVLWPLDLVEILLQRERVALALDIVGEIPRYAVALEDYEVLDLPDHERLSPRQVLLSSSFADFSLVGKALQLLHWVSSHRFCGCCGSGMEPHSSERVLVCTQCATRVYPRINPCVIVLVVRGEQILLARHAGRTGHFFSCLAGFMEVCETPEETIRREVREETAIEVKNIRYVSSQSWPFPSQLMLGFFADYAGGDICVDGKEIEEAHWFSRHCLPEIPPAGISVAGRLIELFLKSEYPCSSKPVSKE